MIVELKQWDAVEAVDGVDALVRTVVGGGMRELVHPSYQSWSYAQLIRDYNAAVQDREIGLYPCVCMHNYIRHPDDPIDAKQYEPYYMEAPVYTKGQLAMLRDYIKKAVVRGDNRQVLYEIENGRIRPSKSLQNTIASMLAGNREFIMIDEQKVVYEKILQTALQCQKDYRKRTIAYYLPMEPKQHRDLFRRPSLHN